MACRAIPAERSRSSGRRSQPPRPTTIAPSALPATRSSLTRPSRTWTTRSARSAEAGSWLTTSAVPPSSRVSSAIRSSTSRAVAASSSPVGSSAIKQVRAACERRTERDALLLSAGKLAGMCVAAVRQADTGQQLVRTGIAPGTRLAGEAELHADELARRQLACERAPVVLVGIADRARAKAAQPASDRAWRHPFRRRSRSPLTAGRSPRRSAAASTCPSRSDRGRRTARPAARSSSAPAEPRRLLPPSRTRGRHPGSRRVRSLHRLHAPRHGRGECAPRDPRNERRGDHDVDQPPHREWRERRPRARAAARPQWRAP